MDLLSWVTVLTLLTSLSTSVSTHSSPSPKKIFLKQKLIHVTSLPRQSSHIPLLCLIPRPSFPAPPLRTWSQPLEYLHLWPISSQDLTHGPLFLLVLSPIPLLPTLNVPPSPPEEQDLLSLNLLLSDVLRTFSAAGLSTTHCHQLDHAWPESGKDFFIFLSPGSSAVVLSLFIRAVRKPEQTFWPTQCFKDSKQVLCKILGTLEPVCLDLISAAEYSATWSKSLNTVCFISHQ